MANWTTKKQPFGANHVPLLEGLSSTDGITPVPVAVDPATGAILTEGGGAGTQYQEGATTSPGTGTLAIGRYLTTPPTLTNGQLEGLQLDSSGNLKVNIVSGGSGGGSVTIADGANVAEGATTDAPVTPGSVGTISGKLRQISSDVSSIASGSAGLALDTTLVRVGNALTRPEWYNPTTNSLKVETTAASTIAVVTSVTNANIGGLGAAGVFSPLLTLLYTGDRNLFANAIRSNIT